VAALGSEARQQRAPVRRAFSSAARGLLEHLQRKVHPGGASPQISDVTLALAARMVGAVVLARLVDDRALAGRILEAVKRS
jgi:TetR/AcrR family transcriptional repressor of nem operon